MDNSDDYFDDDDLVIDEQTEAALAESERQYATQSHRPPSPVAPAAKRLKTSTGWTPGFGARSESLGDFDLPDIILQGGEYSVSSVKNTSGTGSFSQVSPVVVERRPVQGTSRFQQQARNTHNNISTSSASSSSSTVNGSRHPTRSGPNQRPVPANGPQCTAISNAPSNMNATYTSRAPNPLEEQLQQLKQQLEELREANTRMQTNLKNAMEAKMEKEGEVTILRQRITKNAESHVAEIARIKAAKEEAEAKQTQSERKWKEDIERLKTQFAFKRQELEASIQKSTGSNRQQKASQNVAPTPSTGPSTRKTTVATSSKVQLDTVVESPSRPPQTRKKASSPKKSPEQSKKTSQLPGFQNSFITSTPNPLRSTQVKDKIKTRPEQIRDPPPFEPPPFDPSPFEPPPLNPPIFEPPSEDPFLSFPPLPVSNGANHAVLGQFPSVQEEITADPFDDDGDVSMEGKGEPEKSDPPPKDVFPEAVVLEMLTYQTELSRIILTHIHPQSGRVTLDLLPGAIDSGQEDMGLARRYTQAYTSILDCISSLLFNKEYEQELDRVCSGFITIVEILSSQKLLEPLPSLLNLLTRLVYNLPKFRLHLLTQGEDRTSRILDEIGTILVQHASPNDTQENEAIGTETLSLLEALSYNLSDIESERFTKFLRSHAAMTALIHRSRSIDFLTRAGGILVLLSSCPRLCRSLVSIPDADDPPSQQVPNNGIVERLCAILFNSGGVTAENTTLHDTVLTVLATLSLTHDEAHTALIEHPAFFPTLIQYSSYLTAPLWEDDENLLKSPEGTLELIERIVLCVRVVHHFVFRTDPAANLRYRLQHPPQSQSFSQIFQTFIVTFGRLGFGDCPDWAPQAGRIQFEKLQDMSRDILDLVVDGPEGDGIWNAYQEDLDGDNVMDEEELEAEMME